MRVTIVEVARVAGVGTATVDRVLNGRAGVKERTRRRVMAAAEQLGYLTGASWPGPAPRAGALALDFLIPDGNNTFLAMLAGHLEAMAGARRAEATIRVHRVAGFDPHALAGKLEELRDATSGIGVIAIDHPVVREAIRDTAARGVNVLTMVSDLSNVPRVGYVGIDNRAAGRLAGHLLGRFIRPGGKRVALFAGSLSYRGHEEREMGFRHIVAEEYPDLQVAELREVKDDRDRAYREATALLATHKDLAGIYNIGAGTRGIAQALEESGRVSEVVFVCHELTEHTRRFLLSGTVDVVIDQNPRVEARDAIDWLLRAAAGQRNPNLPPIRIQAIFKENMPQD
jgi:LacI family transcriptional regulator